MHKDIQEYNKKLSSSDKEICEVLSREISSVLAEAESKVWHAHPVWFLEGNPIVGYAKRKDNVQLLFWSGQGFNEPDLEIEGTFKASQKRFKDVSEISVEDLHRWLKKSREIQWDYKNIVKRKGVLERLR